MAALPHQWVAYTWAAAAATPSTRSWRSRILNWVWMCSRASSLCPPPRVGGPGSRQMMKRHEGCSMVWRLYAASGVLFHAPYLLLRPTSHASLYIGPAKTREGD